MSQHHRRGTCRNASDLNSEHGSSYAVGLKDGLGEAFQSLEAMGDITASPGLNFAQIVESDARVSQISEVLL